MSEEHGNVSKYYSDFYSQMIGHDATGILKFLWQHPHKKMEKPFKSNQDLRILEVGAGEGEHVDFVIPNYLEYIATDLDIVRLKTLEKRNIKNLKVAAVDAAKTEYLDEYFDRIIATCLLAHMLKPEETLEEWRRILKTGGALTIYIPCEPGLALKTFRRFFTKPKAERMGYQGYDLFIARDHINSADKLCTLISHVFRDDRIKLLFNPFPIKSWYLNLFLVVQIRKIGN
jgi:phosphatidylethanolamine/phosphatidyl-N-methylethanolamine N-methyltransferase